MSSLRNDLVTAYNESVATLIPFTTKKGPIKEGQKYSLQRHQMRSIFQNSALWKQSKKKGGHLEFEHKITHVHVGFQNHGSVQISDKIAQGLMGNIQKHLNILNVEIFGLTQNRWKDKPNYDQALQRYTAWEKERTS